MPENTTSAPNTTGTASAAGAQSAHRTADDTAHETELCRAPVTELINGYRTKTISPVEVTEAFLSRIERLNPQLDAFVEVTRGIALDQAGEAERLYASGEPGNPLTGVPVSIKDAFHIEGVVTTLGSRVHRNQIAKTDSGVVRRLRRAGAVFTGKTNTAEFGQSATTDNLLGPDTKNPWDPTRTPGGSSGGAAASVAAGLSTLAVGSDGGGSIRIPAAFTGLYGLKPTSGLVRDERGFRAMTDFVSAGPMTNTVADARVMLEVLSEKRFARKEVLGLRVAYCSHPEGRPVDPGVSASVAGAAKALEALGHHVSEVELPVDGWNDVFGPLVLDDEHRERGHLLAQHADELTRYERSALKAARHLDPATAELAHALHPRYKAKIDAFFDQYDLILTPTVAVPAFPLGQRPAQIDGRDVDQLWGAFPFAVPFNVAGVPAASVPVGLAGGLPVGAQLVVRANHEGLLLDVSEQLEEAVSFDRTRLNEPWWPTEVGAAS